MTIKRKNKATDTTVGAETSPRKAKPGIYVHRSEGYNISSSVYEGARHIEGMPEIARVTDTVGILAEHHRKE